MLLGTFKTWHYLCWFNQKGEGVVSGLKNCRVLGDRTVSDALARPLAEGTFPLLVVIPILVCGSLVKVLVLHWSKCSVFRAVHSALWTQALWTHVCRCLKEKCEGMLEKGVSVLIFSSYSQEVPIFAVGRLVCEVEHSIETGRLEAGQPSEFI